MLIFLKNIPTSVYNCSVFFSKCENPTTTLTTITVYLPILDEIGRGKIGVCGEKPVRARRGLPDVYPVHLGGRLFLTPLHCPCYV